MHEVLKRIRARDAGALMNLDTGRETGRIIHDVVGAIYGPTSEGHARSLCLYMRHRLDHVVCPSAEERGTAEVMNELPLAFSTDADPAHLTTYHLNDQTGPHDLSLSLIGGRASTAATGRYVTRPNKFRSLR